MSNKVKDNREEQRIEDVLRKQYEKRFQTQRYKDSNLKNTYSEVTEAAMREYAEKRNKEDAIGFSKWIRYNCHPIHDDVYRYDGETRTTEQLYEIYINQKV